MGLEFLFSPVTLMVFTLFNIIVVLLQRLFFPQYFKGIGASKIIVGYVAVISSNIIWSVLISKGNIENILPDLLLINYFSVFFVSLWLLPVSLFLIKIKKLTILNLIVATSLLILIINGFIGVINYEKIIEFGVFVWLMKRLTISLLLVATTVIFSVATKKKRY